MWKCLAAQGSTAHVCGGSIDALMPLDGVLLVPLRWDRPAWKGSKVSGRRGEHLMARFGELAIHWLPSLQFSLRRCSRATLGGPPGEQANAHHRTSACSRPILSSRPVIMSAVDTWTPPPPPQLQLCIATSMSVARILVCRKPSLHLKVILTILTSSRRVTSVREGTGRGQGGWEVGEVPTSFNVSRMATFTSPVDRANERSDEIPRQRHLGFSAMEAMKPFFCSPASHHQATYYTSHQDGSKEGWRRRSRKVCLTQNCRMLRSVGPGPTEKQLVAPF